METQRWRSSPLKKETPTQQQKSTNAPASTHTMRQLYAPTRISRTSACERVCARMRACMCLNMYAAARGRALCALPESPLGIDHSGGSVGWQQLV